MRKSLPLLALSFPIFGLWLKGARVLFAVSPWVGPGEKEPSLHNITCEV